MAGSLGKRIADLERLHSTATRADGPPEGWMETMSASLERAEEAQGDLRRRLALGNLYKFVEREPDGA
jgi:hypothetical protein